MTVPDLLKIFHLWIKPYSNSEILTSTITEVRRRCDALHFNGFPYQNTELIYTGHGQIMHFRGRTDPLAGDPLFDSRSSVDISAKFQGVSHLNRQPHSYFQECAVHY